MSSPKPGGFAGVGRRKAEHGTNSGYQTHIIYGTEPCEQCRAARTAYNQEWRRRQARAASRRGGAA